MSASNASIGDQLKRAKSWEKLSTVAEQWLQSRSRDLDGILIDMNRGRQRSNRAQVARALASVVRESCWTDEEEDAPEEIAHWAAVRKEADARVSSWSRDFLAAIRNLELGLMFDEAATISHAVAALPPAKKDLFANVENMLVELKRVDS